MMNFDTEILQNNIQMGYCDTMKIFGEYLGYTYTFSKHGVGKCKKAVNKFIEYLAKTDLELMEDTPAKKLGVNGDFNRIFSALHEKAEGKPMTKEQYFVRAAELCGEFFGIDIRPVYHMSDYLPKLQEKLSGIALYKEAKELAEKENLELAKKLTELKITQKSGYLTGCIYYALQLKQENQGKLWHACLKIMPHELTAAIFLHAITEK
jgi:hypothetical protein